VPGASPASEAEPAAEPEPASPKPRTVPEAAATGAAATGAALALRKESVDAAVTADRHVAAEDSATPSAALESTRSVPPARRKRTSSGKLAKSAKNDALQGPQELVLKGLESNVGVASPVIIEASTTASKGTSTRSGSHKSGDEVAPSEAHFGVLSVVFSALDRNRDLFLDREELQVLLDAGAFKKVVGANFYSEACARLDADPQAGLGIAQFVRLAMDASGDVLELLRKQRRKRAQAPRAELQQDLFSLFDRDCDEHLCVSELCSLLGAMGAAGDEKMWRKLFKKTCEQLGVDEALGLGRRDFAKFVAEASDEKLRELRDREELLQRAEGEFLEVLFRLFDRGYERGLSQEEIGGFLNHAAFRGSEKERSRLFAKACAAHGIPADGGLGRELFSRLLGEAPCQMLQVRLRGEGRLSEDDSQKAVCKMTDSEVEAWPECWAGTAALFNEEEAAPACLMPATRAPVVWKPAVRMSL